MAGQRKPCANDCGRQTYGTICGPCYFARGRKPKDLPACPQCGQPMSLWKGKTCSACYKNRGRTKTVHLGTICGHEVSTADTKYCRACFDQRRKDIEAQGGVNAPVSGSSFTANGDSAEVATVTPENVRTLADLIRVCQIDTHEWIVERWVANKWEMGSKDPAGNVTTTPLYQIKAWLQRNRPLVMARAEIDALIAEAKQKLPSRPPVPRRTAGAHMLEVSIPDLHLGKLAWAPETGHGNYDSRIASDLYLAALDALIARTQAFAYERVVFPIGNDFFHSDTKQGTTTKGTPLDTDSRFHKTFVIGRKLVTQAIDRLRELGPVTVVVVPGNHDTMASFHLGDSLECLYHATKHVTIENAPVPRKYLDYGRNLILFTHGEKGRKTRLPLLMATERPELFGKALFREAHVGHTHELRVIEDMGVRVRVSPALCPPDAWHSEQHLVGNLRSAEALVWARDDGNVATATYTVRPTMAEAS